MVVLDGFIYDGHHVGVDDFGGSHLRRGVSGELFVHKSGLEVE